MNVLIVDKCLYTRIGISCFFSEAPAINIHHVNSVIDASEQNDMPDPDVILVNLTDYCRINGQDSTLLHFFTQFSSAKIFIYIDTEYPNSARPVILDSHVYIINKQNLIPLLATLSDLHLKPNLQKTLQQYFGDYPVLTERESSIIQYWMEEMPNYKIARRLNICSRTVYVHKQHITEKMHVRNRLEFCYLYNVIKYVIFPAPARITTA